MRKLQLRRGPKADLPTLAEGEPGFVLDEGKLYVGTGAGNVEFSRADHTHSEFDPAGSAAAVEASLSAHMGNKNNPHGVTAAQVGAAEANHTHAQYAPLDSPTFTGVPKVSAYGSGNSSSARLRNVVLGTSLGDISAAEGELIGIYG